MTSTPNDGQGGIPDSPPEWAPSIPPPPPPIATPFPAGPPVRYPHPPGWYAGPPPPSSKRGLLSKLAERGLTASLIAAVGAGILVVAVGWVLLGFLRVVPYLLTIASGGLIGVLAGAPLRGRRNLAVGMFATVVTVISTAVMLYFVARTHAVRELGAGYTVPFWTGWDHAVELVKAELRTNFILYPLTLGSIILAFVFGSGIGRP